MRQDGRRAPRLFTSWRERAKHGEGRVTAYRSRGPFAVETGVLRATTLRR